MKYQYTLNSSQNSDELLNTLQLPYSTTITLTDKAIQMYDDYYNVNEF